MGELDQPSQSHIRKLSDDIARYRRSSEEYKGKLSQIVDDFIYLVNHRCEEFLNDPVDVRIFPSVSFLPFGQYLGYLEDELLTDIGNGKKYTISSVFDIADILVKKHKLPKEIKIIFWKLREDNARYES